MVAQNGEPMTYKYLDAKDLEGIPIKNSYLLIGQLGLNAIDAKHLPLIEAAMTGNFFANCEIIEAFTNGHIEGIPINYECALVFADVFHETNLTGNDPALMVANAKNLGNILAKLDRLDEAIKYYHDAIKLMVDKLPLADWDFRVYRYLEETILQKQEMEAQN